MVCATHTLYMHTLRVWAKGNDNTNGSAPLRGRTCSLALA